MKIKIINKIRLPGQKGLPTGAGCSNFTQISSKKNWFLLPHNKKKEGNPTKNVPSAFSDKLTEFHWHSDDVATTFYFVRSDIFFLKKITKNYKKCYLSLGTLCKTFPDFPKKFKIFQKNFNIFQKNFNIFLKIQKIPPKSSNSRADRIDI